MRHFFRKDGDCCARPELQGIHDFDHDGIFKKIICPTNKKKVIFIKITNSVLHFEVESVK